MMTLSRWTLGAVIVLLQLPVVLPPAATAEQATVLIRVSQSGEVLPLALVRADQVVKKGTPLVFVRTFGSNAAVPAAIAPVDGRVVEVAVRVGQRINLGDGVVTMQYSVRGDT
jgi:biotin carboxyl carrier protein